MSVQLKARGGNEPTWGDTRAWLDDLMEGHGGVVYVETTVCPVPKWGGLQGLWVRVVWKGKAELGSVPEMASGDRWPSSKHRTMPAMIIRLCMQLERKLEDRAHDQAMAASPPTFGEPLTGHAPREP